MDSIRRNEAEIGCWSWQLGAGSRSLFEIAPWPVSFHLSADIKQEDEWVCRGGGDERTDDRPAGRRPKERGVERVRKWLCMFAPSRQNRKSHDRPRPMTELLPI
jgi:hypothetical protein